MKITENINIGGLIFTIDDDALLKLQNYLSSLEIYFGPQDEKEEIIADIETRIAEIFQSQLIKPKEVITITDVDRAIKIIGMPEDFNMYGTNHENQTHTVLNEQTSRLFRDIDHKVLGGVCSGLGHYFSIDPVIIRVLFVILAFFAAGGFLVYLILWIVLPPAISMADKTEMKGHRVKIKY